MIRNNPNIEDLDILGFTYLLTSYADDTTFFIKNERSAIKNFKTFEIFSKYSGLKIKNERCASKSPWHGKALTLKRQMFKLN